MPQGAFGPDPTTTAEARRLRRTAGRTACALILISAIQVDRAVFFSILIIVVAFVPLFTMTGVEGAIFGPMARTYAYALAGAVIATFTVTPVLASLLLAGPREGIRDAGRSRAASQLRSRCCGSRSRTARMMVAVGLAFVGVVGFLASRLGSEFLPALEEGNFWIRASMPMTLSLQDGEAAASERCG